jgi:hypothetical protein
VRDIFSDDYLALVCLVVSDDCLIFLRGFVHLVYSQGDGSSTGRVMHILNYYKLRVTLVDLRPV